jgi:hypothetical protein
MDGKQKFGKSVPLKVPSAGRGCGFALCETRPRYTKRRRMTAQGSDSKNSAGRLLSPVQKDRLLLACYLISIAWIVLELLSGGVHFAAQLTLIPVLSQLLFLIGVIATLYLYITMLLYCIRSRQTSTVIKALWITFFILFLQVGAICYYLGVYRKDRKAEKAMSQVFSEPRA